MIFSDSNIISRMKAGAPLTNNDISRNHSLFIRQKYLTKNRYQLANNESIQPLWWMSLPKLIYLTSPPNFFTPRFLGFESRPFFVDPAVFLLAQCLNIKLKPPPDTSTFRNFTCYLTQHLSMLEFIISTRKLKNFTTSGSVDREICNKLFEIQSST